MSDVLRASANWQPSPANLLVLSRRFLMDLSLLISNLKDFATFGANVEGFGAFSEFLVEFAKFDFGEGVDKSGDAFKAFSS